MSPTQTVNASSAATTPRQLAFDWFAGHPRPYAAGADYRARRMDRPDALRQPLIDVNPAHVVAFDLYDVDDPLRHLDHYDGPNPNWTVTNAASGHFHAGYALTTPVARHDAARLGPMKYLADIHAGLVERLGADPNFGGLLTHNPAAPLAGYVVRWGRLDTYDLDELREWCPATLPARTSTAVGRNVDLFAWAVSEAHRPRVARLLQADPAGQRAEWWRAAVATENQRRFDIPLPMLEVASIARSSASYSIRQYSEAAFSERQRHRQTLWAAKQRDRNEARNVGIRVAHAQGQKPRELAARAGVTVRTIQRVLRAGR